MIERTYVLSTTRHSTPGVSAITLAVLRYSLKETKMTHEKVNLSTSTCIHSYPQSIHPSHPTIVYPAIHPSIHPSIPLIHQSIHLI